MKNNNKIRKLQFIRAKNSFRSGAFVFVYTEKCSNEVEKNKEYIELFISRAIRCLKSHYKNISKFNNLQITLMMNVFDNDYFIQNLNTDVCRFINKKNVPRYNPIDIKISKI